MRDHLFISHATEDAALTDWLVRKLTAHGYRVWCSRFKLLGGERWPKDINKAIKTRTFRMIALLSRHSLEKENPSKERQLALALSKERAEEGFLIPLNLDGLSPTDIGWELSDINWIMFNNWANGLAQLLEGLAAIDAPRPLNTGGRAAAIETFQPSEILGQEEERVISNCLRVLDVPRLIHTYKASREVAFLEQSQLDRQWPAYKIGEQTFLAFYDHPDPLEYGIDLRFTKLDSTEWTDSTRIQGANARHIVTNLIKKSLITKCGERGLVIADNRGMAYFPAGLVAKNKLMHRSYTGRKVPIHVLGERKFGAGRMRYQLGVAFWLRNDVLEVPVVQVKVRVHVTDPANSELSAKGANSRRKKVAKSWFNHEWLSRQLAIIQFLAEDSQRIVIGPSPGEQIVIDAIPLEAKVSPSINDRRLARLREMMKALNASMMSLDADDLDALSDDES